MNHTTHGHLSLCCKGEKPEPTGWLSFMSTTSLLLSEGCWFDSPGLHVEESLGKILNPRTAPDVLVGTLHGGHHHQCMNVWITVSCFGQKRLLDVNELCVTKKKNIFISFKVSLLLLCESLIISLLESPKCAFVFHIHKCVIQILRVTHQPLLTFVLFAWLPKHVSYVRAEHLFPLVLLHILRTEIGPSPRGSPRLPHPPRDTGRMSLLGPTRSRRKKKKKSLSPWGARVNMSAQATQ